MGGFHALIARHEHLKILFIESIDAWWDIRFAIVQLMTALDSICQEVVVHNISVDASIEPRASINGPVFIGSQTIVRDGTYLIGPIIIGESCDIGPNCVVRPNTIIGCNVRIGPGAELKESIVLDGAKISHFSYIGNSVIGKNANIAADVVTAVRRFDDDNITIRIGDEIVHTGAKKFGTLVGNNAQLGVGVHILPGVTIGPNSVIHPNVLVIENVAPGSVIRSSDFSV